MKKISFKKAVISLFAGLFFFSSIPFAQADTAVDEVVTAVYFTGIGCPHCAEVDPILFEEKLEEYPKLIIIEHEIYQEQENADVLVKYDDEYGSGLGIPAIVFDNGEFLSGDKPILKGLDDAIDDAQTYYPSYTGPQKFENVDFNEIPGSPKIWTKNRILLPVDQALNSDLARELLLADNVTDVIKDNNFSERSPQKIYYSGGNIEFEYAAKIGGFIVQWNGEKNILNGRAQDYYDDDTIGTIEKTKLTLTKLISLAIVDAINPCALAVLALMLIGIMAYNPDNRKKILYSGLAFTLAVFIMYLFYGLVIIKLLQVVQAITSVRLILYKALGIFAIIIGLLNMKDFIRYRPGTIGTEMPMFMRPKMKKIVAKITGPRGAFIIGLFVTVFLLPCTIGPYIIAGGVLSTYELLKTLPPLLLYNFIFVLPMLIITGLVYMGTRKIEDVTDWKDKNIRYLHLTAGSIMFLLGLAMFFGWV